MVSFGVLFLLEAEVGDKSCGGYLKGLPSGHSSATWCIMVNVSMWRLPTNVHNVLDLTKGMIKNIIHFNGEGPPFSNMM